MRARPLSERLDRAGRAAAYIVVSLPFALGYVAFEVIIGVVGALLLPVRVGASILLWAEDVVWRFAAFERDLANRLLHARIPPLPTQVEGAHDLRGVRDRMSAPGFARGLALTAAKLPASIVAAVAGLGPVAITLGLLFLGGDAIAAPASDRFFGPVALEVPAGIALCLLAIPAAIASVAALQALGSRMRTLARSLLLTAPAAGSPVREMLAESLGDRTLAIAYWLPDREVFVDESGRPVDLPEPGSGRAWTSVDRGGRRLAAIVHDAELDATPELVQAAAAAAALGLDNERLKADLRARLEELRASRVRLVEASYAARRRIERDLHDGAQQQLVALSIDLRLIKSRVGDDDPATKALVEGASEKLASAITELRELARGIHPAILTERGLGPAVEAIAQRAPVPVECAVDVRDRLIDPLEAAAYFVVAEALTNVAKYSQATSAQVRVHQHDDELEVEVIDDGVGGASTERGSGLRGLGDRVSAVDGTLQVTSPAGAGTRVVARIPYQPAQVVRKAEDGARGDGGAPAESPQAPSGQVA
ncbi:MAG: sensor histidine kinase [Thermoleophilaceae bacterium]